MKQYKVQFTLIAGLMMAWQCVSAQGTATEKVIPLSKSASNGYFYNISQANDGGLGVTFEFAEKKKQKFERYSLDKQLSLLSQEVVETDPGASGAVKEDYTTQVLWANIGGSTSFDVLSSKIKVFRVTRAYKWDRAKQRYNRSVTAREKVVLRNVEDKAYLGYIAFGNEKTGDLIALTAIEQKKDKQFYLLTIKPDLSVNEQALNLQGKHTLVYAFAAQKEGDPDDEFDISNGDLVFIFAPEEKGADFKKYVYMRYDNTGKLAEQFSFTAPSPNLAVTAGSIQNNDVYLFGAYTKSDDSFHEVFNEYGPIPSPGFVATDNTGSENLRMFKYNKAIEGEDMVAMACMKISGGKLEWQREYPIKDLGKLARKAPNQKKPIVY
jgi:hypothetical protein